MAQISLAVMAVTCASELPPAGSFGLGTTLHTVPFQCMVRVLFTLAAVSKYKPTAHTSLDDTTTTSASELLPVLGLGLDTIVHSTPSQCIVRVRSCPPDVSYVPTAQASLGSIPATDVRLLSKLPTLGVVVTSQYDPFQCSANVL